MNHPLWLTAWVIVGDPEAPEAISKKLFKSVDKVCESMGQSCMQMHMNAMESKLKQLMNVM